MIFPGRGGGQRRAKKARPHFKGKRNSTGRIRKRDEILKRKYACGAWKIRPVCSEEARCFCWWNLGWIRKTPMNPGYADVVGSIFVILCQNCDESRKQTLKNITIRRISKNRTFAPNSRISHYTETLSITL